MPIVPGIMPITNVDQVNRFTAKIGASIPAALRAALKNRADDPPRCFSSVWRGRRCSAASCCAPARPGIHFITLNRSPATRAILTALRIAQPWEDAAL